MFLYERNAICFYLLSVYSLLHAKTKVEFSKCTIYIIFTRDIIYYIVYNPLSTLISSHLVCKYIYIYIYTAVQQIQAGLISPQNSIYYKLATVVEGDQKSPFSIATTP